MSKQDIDPAAPIGIFDSGIGGLTVMKEIQQLLPGESVIYLGDSARVPYGTKSDRTIKNFALQCCLFLLEHNVKMIVVACNTASAVALEFVSNMFRVPVIGVIEPGARAAVDHSESGKIGVIATHTTIQSESYTHSIQRLKPDASVMTRSCPLFVPLAEEGWVDHEVTKAAAREYLSVFAHSNIDTLVLGCTHYPTLKSTLQAVMDEIMERPVVLVDSGIEAAKAVKRVLEENQSMNAAPSNYKYYVTDIPKNFADVAERFLGSAVSEVEMVSVDNL